MPHFHPQDLDLIDYAAGRFAEAFGVLIASHLTLCPTCRDRVAAFEALGGTAVESAPVADLSAGSLDRMLARLDEPARPLADPPPPPPALGDFSHLPAPLRAFVKSAPPWKRVIRGLEEAEIGPRQGAVRARMMRIAPGGAMPRHTHGGREMLIVLDGGYCDEIGDYGVGDVAVAGAGLVHQPIADPQEGCLCFAVTDAPLKLTGPLGRLLNMFIRY